MPNPTPNDPGKTPLWLLPQFSGDLPAAAPHPEALTSDAGELDDHAAAATPHQHRSNGTAAGLLTAAGHNGATTRPAAPATDPATPTVAPALHTGVANGGVVDRKLLRRIVTDVSEELSNVVTERKRQVNDDDVLTTDLRDYTDEEERELGREIIAGRVQREINNTITNGLGHMTVDEQRTLSKEVFDTIFGLGPIQPLVEDPDIENILIKGTSVRVMYADGRTESRPPIADTNEEVVDWLTNLAQRASGGGRPFSMVNPHLRLNLPGDIRLSAMNWTSREPQIAIRLHRHKNITLDRLANDYNTMPPVLAEFLGAATIGGVSIVVAGPMGSGKTTHVRALANALPVETRIATAETEFELFLDELPGRADFVLAHEVITGGGERNPITGELKGSTDLSDILYQFVRMQLDRIIVGEVAGKEIIAMFKAMQIAEGSLSTTHSDNAAGAIDRLVTVALEAGVTETYAYRQVAAHIDLIVQLNVDHHIDDNGKRTTTRYISEVLWVEPGEMGMPAKSTIYRGRAGGVGDFGTLPPELRKKVLEGGFPEALIPQNTLAREEGY